MPANVEDALIEFEENPKLFASFIKRFAALMLDGLILVPMLLINWYNNGTLKSLPVFIIAALVQMAYKPFFESRYSATPGKMTLKLQVVNNNFKTIGFKEAVLRDCFGLAASVFAFVTGIIVFTSASFQTVHSYQAYTVLLKSLVNTWWLLGPYYFIMLIEMICVLSDNKRRSVHDRIAGTLVINKPPVGAG